jgi:hypothetical protein
MGLTDKELALRWWNRLSPKERDFYMDKYLPSFTEKNLTQAEIFWVWGKQQALSCPKIG